MMTEFLAGLVVNETRVKAALTLIHDLQFGRGAVLKRLPQVQHFDDSQDA